MVGQSGRLQKKDKMTKKLEIKLEVSNHQLGDDNIDPLDDDFVAGIVKHQDRLVYIVNEFDVSELFLALGELFEVIEVFAPWGSEI